MGEGYGADRLFSYLSEVQPVFNRHCVACHDFGTPEGKILNLAADKELVFNASYADLHRKALVTLAGAGQAEILPAKSWGSHASRLTGHLEGHNGTILTDAEKEKIYTWMDLNGVYYPTYDCAYPAHPAGRSPLTDQQLIQLESLCGINLKSGLRWNTHSGAMLSFDRPEKSPCLQTLETGSREHREALAIIQLGAKNLQTTPRADMPGFVPSGIDRQRTERYEELRRIEDNFRNALREGDKLYDTDLQTITPAGAQP